MKTLICTFLFLLFRFADAEPVPCEKQKPQALFYAIRCCALTIPQNDPEFVHCHAKYAKMANRTADKLQSPERIAINICAHECSLTKKGFFRKEYDNEFDTDAMEVFFETKYKKQEILSNFMIDTFKKCLKFDHAGEVDIKFPPVTFIKTKCDPLSARLMMCVRTKAMQNCPLDAWPERSKNCRIAKLYFKDCVASIERLVRSME